MRSHLLVAVFAMGCGETQLGPFQPLPVDTRFDIAGNDDLIHIARDRFGIAHVYAKTYRDLGFGQGYVMAHDRLAQMEMLRRFASGTLAELYGASDPSVIALDKEMRFHRLRRFAVDTWGELQVRASVRDQQVADLLERFADGVNAYVADQAAGKWPTDPAIRDAGLEPLFAPARFTPWTPVDSVAIMRLYTFAQSWTVPDEIDLTELDVKITGTFSAALARDLLALQPIPALGATPMTPSAGTAAPATRPAIPDALFASARAFFPRTLPADPTQTLGPHALMRPFIGSNAVVVGVDFTGQELATTTAILAADMQLALSNPATFYPMHQLIGGALPEDPLVHDVLGLMLPGVPVAIAGTNGAVGWAPTVGTHDVNDIYVEQLSTTNGVTGSRWNNLDEPLEHFDEDIAIGSFGEIASTERVSYEIVTRHGPVIPGHPADSALSIRYTGYAATHELATLWELGDTSDVDHANLVLGQIEHGPHFMLVDARGAYAWTSNATVPERMPAALAWNAASPGAAAPFFVLDGTNPAHDWADPLPLTQLPFHSPLEPFIVAADDDPTGATRDGDPLNQTYTGIAYANGLRDERMRALLLTAPRPIQPDTLIDILHDTRSTLGERVKTEVARLLDEALPAVPPMQQAAVTLARDVLAEWSGETPVGAVAANADSGATLFFNTWMHHFVTAAIGDELAAADYRAPLDDDRVARIVYRLLIAPATMAQHPVSNEPLVCGAGGCRALVVQAALSAIADLTADGSGRDDWRWGRRHALVLRTPFPDDTGALRLPREAENMIGFQLPGDGFSVARADGGWADTDFRPRTNVAYRMQLIGSPVGNQLVMRLELPTGSVLDTRDPHYRDLLETSYLTGTPFTVPFPIDQINAAGESRWEFR